MSYKKSYANNAFNNDCVPPKGYSVERVGFQNYSVVRKEDGAVVAENVSSYRYACNAASRDQ